MKNKLKNITKQDLVWAFKATMIMLTFFTFAHIYHVSMEWLEVYKLRSPIVLQYPWEERYVNPVSIKVTPLNVEKENEASDSAKLTPTPTPNEKALKIDLVRDVSASEIAYSYHEQKHVMSKTQLENMAIIESELGEMGAQLVFKESGFHNTSVNSTSGACGLFQAYPCVKMGCELNDVDCQVEWGKDYIERRYGSVENAYKFHQQYGWY